MAVSKIICGQMALNASWQAGRPVNESDWDGGSGISGTVSSGGPNFSICSQPNPEKAMSWGLTNEATVSHGPSSRAAASSPNSSTTCSAKTPSRTVPQSDLAAPCGSRPIHPENPKGSSRSALL